MDSGLQIFWETLLSLAISLGPVLYPLDVVPVPHLLLAWERDWCPSPSFLAWSHVVLSPHVVGKKEV